MNSLKLISATALLALAASSAFATEFDGKADNAWLTQTAVSQQAKAPAPTAAAGQDKQELVKTVPAGQAKDADQSVAAGKVSSNNAVVVP